MDKKQTIINNLFCKLQFNPKTTQNLKLETQNISKKCNASVKLYSTQSISKKLHASRCKTQKKCNASVKLYSTQSISKKLHASRCKTQKKCNASVKLSQHKTHQKSATPLRNTLNTKHIKKNSMHIDAKTKKVQRLCETLSTQNISKKCNASVKLSKHKTHQKKLRAPQCKNLQLETQNLKLLTLNSQPERKKYQMS